MSWFSGGPQAEAKKLIAQLSDLNKSDIAAQSLIKMGTDAVPSLIEALQTQDLNLLHHYQQILARIPSATDLLTKALATAHPLVRGRIAEIFSITKDKSAIPALLDTLDREYFTVRARAAWALANIGDEKVIPNLLPLLKDKEVEVRIATCAALGKFTDPSTFDEIANVLLDDNMIEVRQAAARALGDSKHPAAIPFLMEALRDSYWWFEKEQAAKVLLTAIEGMGLGVVEPLIEALGDKEGTVRKFAAIVLGNLRDDSALDELGMTIYDLHHEVSRAAAEALTKFGSKSVNILIQALTHPEADVRECAVEALGKIQDVRVTPALIEMVRDPDRNVKKQTLQSLGKLRDERTLSILQKIAADRSDREFSMLAKKILETHK